MLRSNKSTHLNFEFRLTSVMELDTLGSFFTCLRHLWLPVNFLAHVYKTSLPHFVTFKNSMMDSSYTIQEKFGFVG